MADAAAQVRTLWRLVDEDTGRASQKGKTNKDFPKKNNKVNYKKGTAAGLQNKEDKKKKK